jgi:ribonuclease P protein component
MKRALSKYSLSDQRILRLPKSDILRRRTHFKRLFEGPITSYSEEHLSLRFYTFDEQDYVCKMAFIVAKRLGKATERNYTRRLFKEAYRLNRHSFVHALCIAPVGFHGALIAKTVKMDFDTAKQEIIHLLDSVVNHLYSTFDL